jgi:iron complex outermembrane receptor protein
MHARPTRNALSPITIAVVAALAAAPAVHAQEAGETAGELEEIVVTAQKREQNLQEVPLAVSVLSGDLIDRSTAYNIEGLNALVPSLNFRKGGTSINSTLFLRGVGTVNFSLAAEPSVATVLDGVVLARSGEAFGDLNDIERIEVLRGPQGTLFGKNASAGVVSIVSRMPSDEFGTSAQVDYYDGGEWKLRGTLDAPLSETFGTRTTAFYGEYDGNIDNLYDGREINGYKRWGVRSIGRWDATEALTFTFIGDYRKADDNCCGEVIGTAPNNVALRTLLSGVNLREDETREVRHNLVTRTEETAWGLSAQIDWELAEHVLTSITAYRSWDAGEIREGDWLDRPAAYVGNGFAQLHDDGPQESTTFSQEIRLASPTGQFLEYVVGIFYFDSEAERDFARDVIVCTASTLPVDATGSLPCAPGSSTFTNPNSSANFGSDSTNLALFGEGTLNLSDAWRLVLGLRYTQDELSYFHDRIPSPVAGPGVRTDTSGYRDETDEDAFSGRAAVQWDVSDDLMTYLSYSRGYKGPAYNVFFNMNPNSLNALDPETADAYEAGIKATLFDGSTIANLAVF